MSGKIVTVRNVLDIVVRDRTFYEKSGGGITISGGEPLFQPEFTKALLQTATEENIHTCIETSGYAPSRVIKEIIPYTNLFLFDYKETDSKRHEFYTGKGNKSIIDNLRRIDSAGKTIILRCPIIPQINDRLDHYQGIAMIANNFKNIVKIELLPYHPLGIKKRSAIDMEILYDNNSFMPKTAIEEIAEKIRSLTDKEIISH